MSRCYRFLLRATQRDPDSRFQSADEMADQLGGVLRDVVAGTRPPQPVEIRSSRAICSP